MVEMGVQAVRLEGMYLLFGSNDSKAKDVETVQDDDRAMTV
jgi:hypothetical protein